MHSGKLFKPTVLLNFLLQRTVAKASNMANYTCSKSLTLSFKNHSLPYSKVTWKYRNSSMLLTHATSVWCTRETLNMTFSCLCFSNYMQSLIHSSSFYFNGFPAWIEDKVRTIWRFAFQGHISGFLAKALVFSVDCFDYWDHLKVCLSFTLGWRISANGTREWGLYLFLKTKNHTDMWGGF